MGVAGRIDEPLCGVGNNHRKTSDYLSILRIIIVSAVVAAVVVVLVM